MRSFIIFICSMVLIGSSWAMLSQKLKEKIFSPKECHPKIIETYTASNAPRYSVQSDESMLELCPNLQESCCSKNNLNDLHVLVLDAVKSLKSFEEKYTGLVSDIVQADEEVVEEFIGKFKVKAGLDDQEDEFAEEFEEVVVLQNAINYLKQNKSVILEDLNASIEFVVSVNSRFGCGVCNRDNLYSFSNMKSREPKLQLDMSQCRNIFDDPRAISLFRLDMHTNYVYEVTKAMVIVERGSSPSDHFMSEDELSNIPSLIENCMEESNFLKLHECRNLCMSMKFFNANPFFNIEKSVIAGYILSGTIFKKRPKLSEAELNIEYERFEKEIVKRLFVMPHEGSAFHIEFFETEFKWKSGWNLMNFEMNYDSVTKPMVKKTMEDFILRAVRSPKEFFENTPSKLPHVDSNSSKILSFLITALVLLVFSN